MISYTQVKQASQIIADSQPLKSSYLLSSVRTNIKPCSKLSDSLDSFNLADSTIATFFQLLVQICFQVFASGFYKALCSGSSFTPTSSAIWVASH
jgi:hypothetical protein